ncbi:major facilitator superfamily protein [Rhodococcus opacus M213]|uniref:Major facilitator superfamily protein n=1 Tax=Rhodococcus opacus M213 TaxID=1129896 RepID=K8XIP4_RHOOP|nr:major facilitator superfamily protein [Rhodococcus opacus M213]
MLAPSRQARLQRRVVWVLAAGQVLGGLGTGVALSLGALLITRVSGSPAWSGMAATMGTLGAALLAIPLARLAQSRGRRISLSAGAAAAVVGGGIVVAAAALGTIWLLLGGMLAMGAAQAVNLQARFAATDLASAGSRARDLSLVVWSTTIGAMAGPNLFEPGEAIGRILDLPPLTGGIVIAVAAQTLGAVVYLLGLRPDPLLVAAAHPSSSDPAGHRATPQPDHVPEQHHLAVLRSVPAARRSVATLALSHAVMVALMSMTPVHLVEHGASLNVVGVTISLHVAGMYAFSPVFGFLADRVGARWTILLGQALFVGSLLLSALGSGNPVSVTISLVLLGLGWSASTVAGSALVSAAAPPAHQPRLQGVSDTAMNLTGAAGGAAAGLILAGVGFGGLSASLLVLVVVIVLMQGRR